MLLQLHWLQLLLIFCWFCLAQTTVSAQDDEIFSTCEGCFCITDDGKNGECPTALEPPSTFDYADNLMNLTWSNPITLDCNPYTDSDCQLTQNMAPLPNHDNDKQDLFCVVEFDTSNAEVQQCAASYATKTYSSSELSTLDNADDEQQRMVTHTGPCGACSSLQDLAVYMRVGPDLRQEATLCGAAALRSEDTDQPGRDCFLQMGFTQGCSEAWLSNTVQTRTLCLLPCAEFLIAEQDNNEPEYPCELHPCLECDETNAGPIFQKFAGRTRRNSGLRSSILRLCSEMEFLAIIDPCEALSSSISLMEQIQHIARANTEDDDDDDDDDNDATSDSWRSRNHATDSILAVVVAIAGMVLLARQ